MVRIVLLQSNIYITLQYVFSDSILKLMSAGRERGAPRRRAAAERQIGPAGHGLSFRHDYQSRAGRSRASEHQSRAELSRRVASRRVASRRRPRSCGSSRSPERSCRRSLVQKSCVAVGYTVDYMLYIHICVYIYMHIYIYI